MIVDYTSLLVATGITAAAAGLTFLVSWLSDRSVSFLAICAAAMLAVAGAISLFVYFTATFDHLVGLFGATFLMIALSLGLAGAEQFRHHGFSPKRTLLLAGGLIGLMGLPYILGFTGLAFLIINAAACLLTAIMARNYWHCRAENPAAITGIVVLYGLLSLSFAACFVALAMESPLVLSAPPDNWAESANLVICVLGVTGIGALSVALNHQRLVQRHRDAARTDPLTGLFNRRALFDTFKQQGLPPEAAILEFDFDHFKKVNDIHGHAMGDRFLILFAEILNRHLASTDFAARLGGEEFVVVLEKTNLGAARSIAEAIRLDLAREAVAIGDQTITATVSIGLYTNATAANQDFDDALRSADEALYRAKNDGRNRVCVGGWLAAA